MTTSRALPGDADPAPPGELLPPPLRPGAQRRRPPTRRTAHSVESIVAAAIEVLDEEGVGGISMRRVAERLGTGPASLYAHVSGRDELLGLVFDELVGQVALPAPDAARWRAQIHEMLGGLRSVLATHRDAALAGLGRIPTTPRVLTAAEALVAVMEAGGLTERVIALGFDQMTLYVCACALEESLMAHNGLGPQELERYYAEVHAFYSALPAQRFPRLAAVAPAMFGPDDDERFEFGLDVLIDGLEAASARERAAVEARPGRRAR